MFDSSQFRFIEVAEGGANRRNGVTTLQDWQRKPKKLPDTYRTFMRFTADLRLYHDTHTNASGNPTIKDYTGPGYLDSLNWDFDSDDPANALVDIRKLVAAFQEDYGCGDALQVWFTGKKGFHVRVPGTLFGGIAPMQNCRELADVHKRLSRLLLDPLRLSTWDSTVLNADRLWREENTKHGKTGLYKIPLAPTQVADMHIDTIREYARNQRHATYWQPDSEWEPRETLADLYYQALVPPPVVVRKGGDGTHSAPDMEARSRAVEALAAAWPAAGARHYAFMALAGGLLRAGWVDEDTTRFLIDLAYETMAQAEADSRTRDGEFDRIVSDTRGKIGTAAKLTGWPELVTYTNEEAVTAARTALGLYRSREQDDDPYDADWPEPDENGVRDLSFLSGQSAPPAYEDVVDREDDPRDAIIEDLTRRLRQLEDAPPQGRDTSHDDCLLERALLALSNEVYEMLLMFKGAKSALASYARAIKLIFRKYRGDTDAEGWSQTFRCQLAQEAGTNEKDAGTALRWMAEDEIILDWTKYDDDRLHHSKHQKPLVEEMTAWQRLRARITRMAQAWKDDGGEKRGRTPAAARRPVQDRTPPCPEGVLHPIDAVCRVDKTVVRHNIPVMAQVDIAAAEQHDARQLKAAWQEEMSRGDRADRPGGVRGAGLVEAGSAVVAAGQPRVQQEHRQARALSGAAPAGAPPESGRGGKRKNIPHINQDRDRSGPTPIRLMDFSLGAEKHSGY